MSRRRIELFNGMNVRSTLATVYAFLRITVTQHDPQEPFLSVHLNSTQLNSTENYGRRCLTPLSPHRNYILS